MAHVSTVRMVEKRASGPDPVSRYDKVAPARMLIVGVVLELCPGGVQIHYRTRLSWHPSMGTDILPEGEIRQLLEHELVAYPD